MASHLMEMLSRELSEALGIELTLDSLDVLAIAIQGVEVQLEIEAASQQLKIACDLGFVGAGRYRDNLFKEALRANGLPLPHTGSFAYSRKKQSLVLYHLFSTEDISGAQVAAFLIPFSEKAALWQEALKRGAIPQVQDGAKRAPGMFGL